MSKKCPKCESKDIHITYYPAPTDNMATCYGCGYADLADRFPEQSVFDHITASEEVLADKFVYCAEPERFCECADWRSIILGNVSFATRDKAYSATLEKLKEVEKDEQ